MRAELNTVVFEAGAVTGFTLATFDGWDDGPTPRSNSDLIPNADGAFEVSRTLLAPRVMSLTGLLLEGDDAQRLAGAFRGIHSHGQPQTLVVDDRDGRWNLLVSVEEARLRPIHGGIASYVLALIARDPVKYAPEVTVGPVGIPTRSGGLVLPSAFPWHFGDEVRATLTLDNIGAVAIRPRVMMTGSADGVVIHGGPRRIEFGAFDGNLIVDSAARRAWLNGTDVTRQLGRRDWHEVPAGVAQDFYFTATDPSPDTVMTVEYRIGAW